MKPVVSLVKTGDADIYGSLREVLDLCQGLQEFSKGDRILIKPNLVAWDFDLPFPPYGVVATSAVVFALVKVLAEEGFNNIAIGESPLPGSGLKGEAIYQALGYNELVERYGIELIDFNEGSYPEVDCGEFKLRLAQRALEADRIINVPVLKTHNQTKVSLGIKNLKGCLDPKSKRLCHGAERDLSKMFPRIIEKLPVSLTVIDGIFALEKGPGITGKALRTNLLIASRDTFACDKVGAELMGYKVEDVPHLAYYAGRHGLGTGLADLLIKGEKIVDHRQLVDFDWEWAADDTGPAGFAKRGIAGLAVRKYDSSLCTGCSMMYNPMLIMLMSAYRGQPFPGLELVSGKRQLASPGFEHTVLFGHCSCRLNKDNPEIKQALPVKGCPPDLKQFDEALRGIGITCDYKEYIKYRHYLHQRYKKEDGFNPGYFTGEV